MRSPAAAIAWEFRQRHRWGLIALGVYLISLAAIKLAVVASGQRITFDSPEMFAFVVVIPVTATFTYFLAVFTFGLEGDLAARQSMYPPRLFTRPVTTSALAGLPMLYGVVAMIALWTATRLLALWPSGLDVPVVWPALLAASLLAWTQALAWLPYPLPGLRIVVLVLWLTTIDTIVLLGLQYRASETLMVAFLAPHVPLAYFGARYSVARARRGEVPDWRGLFAWVARTTDVVLRPRRAFRTPQRAQVWFEWQQHGRSLPTWVAVLLPFELALLLVAGDTPALVFTILAGVLLTPVIMAVFAAATVRSSKPQSNVSHRLTPFLATRPVTTASLVAAKLEATIWSTIAAWMVVFVAIPLGLRWTHTWPVVAHRIGELAQSVGTPRAVVLGFMIVSGLMLWTWKQLVQSLYIGLSGRGWLIKGSVFVTLSALFLIGPIIQLVSDDRGVQNALWSALPLLLAIAVALKMSAAAWTAQRLDRRRLVSGRALMIGAAVWCAVVLGAHALMVWWMATVLFPNYLLALLAILAIPLARIAAAPLALEWNRHR